MKTSSVLLSPRKSVRSAQHRIEPLEARIAPATVTAGSAGAFTDSDGDLYKITLTGPGTAEVTLDDGDGDLHGSIASIVLANTTEKSKLTIKVKKAKLTGDGKVTLGALTGTGALGAFTAAQSDLVGAGIQITGALLGVTVGDLLNGADLVFGGAAPAKTKLKLKLGAVGDGSDITSGLPIASLSAQSVGAAVVTAPGIGSIKTSAGGFAADLDVAGAVGPIKVASGGAAGAWTAASFGPIKVTGDFAADLHSTASAEALGKLFAFASLTINKGNLTGDLTTLGKAGPVKVIGDKTGLGGRIVDSAIEIGGAFAGISARSMSGATITAATTAKLATTGGGLFANITVAGSMGAVSVAGGSALGVWLADSAKSVSVKGGDFAAQLFLTMPALTAGKKTALGALTVTGGDFLGKLGSFGKLGSLSVRSSKTGGGEMTDAMVFGAEIKKVTVAGAVTNSAILAGANFGADFAFDAGDSFGAGSIGAFAAGSVVSSVIGAGFFTDDAELNDDDAGLLGGAFSVVKKLSVGAADAASLFAAVTFPARVKIGATVVIPSTDLRFLTSGSADARMPGLAAALFADTGISATDGITNNPALRGRITDNSGQPVLQAAIGNGAFADVSAAVGADGRFTLDVARLTTLNGGTLPDGAYSVQIRGSDPAGNDTAPLTIAFTLDRIAPGAPTLNLSAGSDTGAAGDNLTSAGVVTLTGAAEEGLTVKLGSLQALAGAGGAFTFPDFPLAEGDNLLVAQVSDVAGNVAQTMRTVTRSGILGADDVVLEWNAVNLEAIRLDAAAPPLATRALAMTSGAMFDVINAFEGNAGFFLTVDAPSGASLEAAVAAAAHNVLVAAFPGQKVFFDASLAATLARVPDGASETAGVTFGAQIGATIVALRSQDGFDQYGEYAPGDGIGEWQQTGPMFGVALLPQWARLEPFLMTSADQFRPAAPPVLGSAEYTAAFNEVKALGVATGGARTATQTEIARFWADGSGTYTPAGHWNQIAMQFAQESGFSTSSNARLLAQLNLALADAAIVAWDAKFTYDTWRPETAIQQAALDGNPQTSPDAAWRPLLISPPFPEYVSGHSTFSATAAEVLASTFGDSAGFTIGSLGLPGVTRTFANFEAAAIEAGRSRVFGGIHFDFANVAGQEAGRDLGAFALSRFSASGDFAAPKVLIGGPSSGLVTAADFNVTGRVLDNISGVATFTAQLDDGAVSTVTFGADGTFTLPVTLAGLAQGVHTITFSAVDAAGNVASPKLFTFTLDTLNPTLEFASSLEGATLTAGTLLAGTADGTGSNLVSLKYAFDGGTPRTIGFGTEGAFAQQLNLRGLGAGAHTLEITATDAAGKTASANFNVTLDGAIPFTVTGATPADAVAEVGTTFRPQVYFSRPVDAATLNANNFYATGPDGAKLPASIIPAADGSFAWLFFNSPMPGGAQVTITVEGASILAGDGTPLDADNDGTAGGAFNYAFKTVSLAPVAGTTLTGRVLDPGPDLKPGTFDDVRAGADGILHTADDVFLNGLAGVKVFILGLEHQAVFTDAQGNFTLTSVPAGNVKLAIDGNTATNAPSGFYFPEMVMDQSIRPGVANTVMDTMGTLAQQIANLGRTEVYLPRLRGSLLQDVGAGGAIGVDAVSAPNLTDAQRAQLVLEVQPGSLIGPDGLPVANPQIGISTVPPELVREMLPPGVLQHTFDITIQAPGAAVFDRPLELTFPNVFNAAPGTVLNFLSFDHTTGRLVIEGTATVSADGLSVTTDPGNGITKPGWHGLTPPGLCVGSGGAPMSVSREPGPMDTVTEFDPVALPTIFGQGGGGIALSWGAPAEFPGYTPPPPSPLPPDCDVPQHAPEGSQARAYLNVTIEVDGPLATFLKRDPVLPGAVDLVSQSFTLTADNTTRVSFFGVPKNYDELFNTPGAGFDTLESDQLYGSRIKVTEIRNHPDGSRDIDIRTYFLYRWVDAIDPVAAQSRTGNTAVFQKTLADGPGGIERVKTVDLALPSSVSTQFTAGGQFNGGSAKAGSTFGTWIFDPLTAGAHTGGMNITVQDGAFTVPIATLQLKGTALTPVEININTHGEFGYVSELKRVILSLQNAMTPGMDFEPGFGASGAFNGDDDGLGGVKNNAEYGWIRPGPDGTRGTADDIPSDDRMEVVYPTTNTVFKSVVTAGVDGVVGTADDVQRQVLDYAVGGAYGSSGDRVFDNFTVIGEKFRNEFSGFMPSDRQGPGADGILGTPDDVFLPAQLAALDVLLETKAQEMRGAVIADYDPINSPIVNAYTFVDTYDGANKPTGDVTMAWRDTFSGASLVPGVKPMTYGFADADADRTVDLNGNGLTMQPFFIDPTLPVGAKMWLLAEELNGRVSNEGTFALAINASWDSGATFAQFVANTVSHEIGHTFGLKDAYTNTGTDGGTANSVDGNSIPFDIMRAGNDKDIDLTFAGANPQLLAAAMGIQGNHTGFLAAALAQYRATFNLPGSNDGIRETGETFVFGELPEPPPNSPIMILLRGGSGSIAHPAAVEAFGPALADGLGGAIVTADYTVKNVGFGPMTMTAATFADGGSGFSIVDSSFLNQPLLPGEAATFTIAFDPTVAGDLLDRLTIASNAGNAASLGFEVTGTGIANAPAAALAMVGNNNLGGVKIAGGTAAKPEIASIVNQGGQPLQITGIRFTEGSGTFSLLGVPADLSGAPITLAPGEEFTFGVAFDPAALGLARAGIEVLTNDPLRPIISLGAAGTGIADGVVEWGNDFVALKANSTIRTVSNAGGAFDAFLPATTNFEAVIFDPKTGMVSQSYGKTGVSGRGQDITGGLVFAASLAPDSDFDGLPDDIEFAVGTATGRGDTDGDGHSDFAEVMRGLDPLGGRSLPVGVVSAVAMAGEAKEVVTAALAGDSARQLAFVATGTAGLAVVDVTDVSKPALLAQLELPGDATDVAVDSLLNIAVIVTNAGGTHFVDVGDPARPSLLRTVNANASQVEIGAGVAIVTAGTTLRTYDVLSGDFIQSLSAGPNPLTGLALDGGSLFTMEAGGGNTLRAFDFTGGTLAARDTLAMPAGGGKIFAGGGVAYAGASAAGAGGFATANVADLNDLTLLSAPDDNALGGTAFAASGSRFGVTVGHSDFVFGNFRAMDVMDLSDPANTANFVTRINLPERPLGVALGSGFALVADGTAGLQIVNFLSADVAGVPPAVSLLTPGVDVDPGTPGTQAVEGTTFPISVQATDDAAIARVDLLINGVPVVSDVSFPFDFATIVPPLAGGATLTLQARATDIGGNVALSAPQFVTVVADTFAPVLVRQTPGDGAARTTTFRTVLLTFSEPMDASDFTAESIHLIGPGGNIAPTAIDVRSGGRQVRVEFPALVPGNYTFTLDGNEVSDVAGNLFGAGPVNTGFEIVNATTEWINPAGGAFNDPANWSAGVVPGPADDVFIGLEDDFTVTVAGGSNHTVNRLFVDEDLSILGSLTVSTGTLSLFHNTLLSNGSLVATAVNNGVFVAIGNSSVTGAFTNSNTGTLRLETTFGSSTLTFNGNAANAGLVEINGHISGAIGTLAMGAAATFTNTGTVRAQTFGGQRNLNGAVINHGTIEVLENLTMSHAGRTVDFTGGTVEVAAGKLLTVDQGTTTLGATALFTGGGTMNFSGTQTVNLASDFTNPAAFGGITNLGTLTWAGPGVLINQGNFTINGDTLNIAVTNAGTFGVQSGTSSVGGLFTNTATGALRLATNTGSITLNLNGNATNAGLVEINGHVSGAIGTLAMGAGSTLTNTGTVRAQSPGGQRNFNGAVINNGMIEVLETLTMSHAGRTVDFTGGTVDVAAGKLLTVDQGTTTLGATAIFTGAGTVNFSGTQTVNLASDFTNPAAFGGITNLGTLTWTGPGSLINQGNFTINGDTLNIAVSNAGTFRVQSGTSSVGGLFTNTAAGTLRLETNTGSITLNLNGNATNAGLVEINGHGSGAIGTLAMGATSTFTNTGTVRALTAGGQRNFNGAVINNGTIEVLETLTMSHAARTVDFTGGTVDVAAGKLMTVDQGTTTLGATAMFTGAGTVNFSGTQTVNLASDFTNPAAFGGITNLGALTWAGPGALINQGNFTINGDTLNIGVNNLGTFTLQSGTSSITASFANAPSGNLIFETSSGSITLNLTAGGVNDGLILLNGHSSGAIATFNIGAGSTLVNQGTLRAQTAGGSRSISGSITNLGTIDVLENLTLTHAAGSVFDCTAGTINIAASRAFTINGGTTQMGSGTTLLGSGALTFGGTQTVNVASNVTRGGITVTLGPSVTKTGAGNFV